MARNNWTYEEHIVVFNLYCKIPFSKINANYPPVKELANLIGRSDGAVAMKLANFARLDPAQQARNISGLSQGAKGEEEVWKEFEGNWDALAWHSEQILANYRNKSVEQSTEIKLIDLPEGKEREAVVRLRVNQSFFRKTILASYNNKCCITGLAIPELLIASHIKPWAKDSVNRINPANGLCLNPLFDRAFDCGIITITPDFNVKVIEALLFGRTKEKYFISYHNTKITLPQKFHPGKEFLEYHNQYIFRDFR